MHLGFAILTRSQKTKCRAKCRTLRLVGIPYKYALGRIKRIKQYSAKCTLTVEYTRTILFTNDPL